MVKALRSRLNQRLSRDAVCRLRALVKKLEQSKGPKTEVDRDVNEGRRRAGSVPRSGGSVKDNLKSPAVYMRKRKEAARKDLTKDERLRCQRSHVVKCSTSRNRRRGTEQ